MKWQGEPAPECIPVPYGLLPETVRSQGQELARQLGSDAAYVQGPLAYAVQSPRAFARTSFVPYMTASDADPIGFSRVGWLDALDILSHTYLEIPCILWDTLAVMGLRPSPGIEEKIPDLGTILRHDWGISDAALHAAAKATAFWTDICRVQSECSGYYAEHGCGCSHIVRELSPAAAFPALSSDRRAHVAREFWEHFMSELALIYVLGFPFALNQEWQSHYAGSLVAA